MWNMGKRSGNKTRWTGPMDMMNLQLFLGLCEEIGCSSGKSHGIVLPNGNFSEKRNAFRDIPLISLLPEWSEYRCTTISFATIQPPRLFLEFVSAQSLSGKTNYRLNFLLDKIPSFRRYCLLQGTKKHFYNPRLYSYRKRSTLFEVVHASLLWKNSCTAPFGGKFSLVFSIQMECALDFFFWRFHLKTQKFLQQNYGYTPRGSPSAEYLMLCSLPVPTLPFWFPYCNVNLSLNSYPAFFLF